MSHRTLCLAAGVTAAAALSTSASAGVVPALELDIVVSDGTNLSLTPSGTDLGNGLFNYDGDQSNGDWVVDWDLNASDDISSGQLLVTNGFTVENLSDQVLDFELTVTLPVAQALTFTDYFGSIGLGISGVDGELASIGGPVWSGLLDGATVVSAFEDPYSLAFAGVGSADDNVSGLTGSNGGVNDSIGIRLAFSLTPGEQLGTTGSFAVIPGPAGLGLLAVAGLGGRRRRRG